MDVVNALNNLVKTFEAGNYNVSPSNLVQGGALMVEDLSPVMENVTFSDEHIILQKLFTVKKAKSLLVQFDRQLSYGRFGNSAQREGAVGSQQVSDFVRAVVPMSFYSHLRKVTLVSTLVETVDGKDSETRAQEDAAMLIAADVEFDLFKGKADFSNAGVFDGNPLAMADMPNILGIDSQIRQSDYLATTQDLMFSAFGSNQSVVLMQDGALDQIVIEDSYLRGVMNHGKANRLMVDPIILSGYNKKIALGAPGGVSNSIQRIVLSGSAQDVSGADLRRQFVSGGQVSIEPSRFLSGKTSPFRPLIGAPVTPAISVQPAASGSGSLLKAQTATKYFITAENEVSEGPVAESAAVNITAGQVVTLTIAPQSGVKFFNMYRGKSLATAKYIGKVVATGGATLFTDLGNKAPGFVTGYLVQEDTWGIHELAPYSKLKMAIADLSMTEAHYRFLTVAGYQPRKNILIDNLY